MERMDSHSEGRCYSKANDTFVMVLLEKNVNSICVFLILFLSTKTALLIYVQINILDIIY